MNALTRRLRPGGFAWLVAHELRLAMRAAGRRWRNLAVGTLLLALYVLVGIWIGSALAGMPITANGLAFTVVLAASALLLSFMTTQAMLRSQHTLYETGDLDLLLSAPVAPRIVLAAKLCGIAASVVIAFALLVLPVAIPVALQGHPGLLGIPALLAALALISACLGLAITLAIVSLAGPRAARTVGQIVGALLGGGFFILTQFLSNQTAGRQSGAAALFAWLDAHHLGADGAGALPGRAAFGDPLAIALLLGGGVALFAVTGALFGHSFLVSYQRAGMRLSRRRAAAGKGSIARHFRPGLFASMFAKERRLLARDPATIFQILLRLIYLAPLALVAFGHGRGPPVLPAMAFASVLIAGQLAGSLAWLTTSAEDAPDLLAVAPVARAQVERAKLASALALAAPLGLVLPIAIALASPAAALLTLALTAAGGAAAGLIEIKWQKPAPRKTFARRRSGSLIAGLLTFLVTAFFGGLAAWGVWRLG
jgi:ABC-2 type transport system permease protein